MNSNNTDFSQMFETSSTRLGKFILFAILQPPAVFCNLFLLYHLITDRALRRGLHNHVVLALLIVSLLTNVIEVPRILAFLHQSYVAPATTINCLIWQWCDFTLCSLNNLLMFWMSIERHLLVFHSNLFHISKYRWLLHYLPLITLVIYIATFYAIVIFFYPCQPQPNYFSVLCGLPCFSLEVVISTFDLVAHNLIPLIFDVILSIALILRVLIRRRVQVHQAIQWRKYHKMITQLLILSLLYSVTVAPYALIPFVGLFGGLTTVATYMQTVYFYYLFWLLTLLLPIVCIACISEVRIKLLRSFRKFIGQQNTVVPFIATLIHIHTIDVTHTVQHK